jgi:hypothetical protein
MLMDVLYVAAGIAFFAVSVSVVYACERLRKL